MALDLGAPQNNSSGGGGGGPISQGYNKGIPLRDDDVNLDSESEVDGQSEHGTVQKKTEPKTKKEKKVEMKKQDGKQKKTEKETKKKEDKSTDLKVAILRKRYRRLLFISLPVYVLFLAIFFFIGGHRWFGLNVVSAFT